MSPAPEAVLLAAPDAAPSLTGAVVRIALVLALLFAAAWAVMRWQRRTHGNRRELQVLDRVALARGASVALVRVADRRLLLGVTAEGVRLLRDLDTRPGTRPRFGDVLSDAARRERALR